MGRDIQKAYGQEQQVVMTLPLLEGTDGVLKMSKSYNNYVGVDDAPADMFGKIMSISDELMWKYYELLSSRSLDEIQDLKEQVLKGAVHPMDAKMALAREMVERFHGAHEAELASESFTRVFKERPCPMTCPRSPSHLRGRGYARCSRTPRW